MTEEVQKINKLVAIYGRVSTSNQENEGTIESQLLAVRDFAKKNGYIIVKEYLDDGWSGDILVRPALDQLRMDAKQKNWEGVLIYDPDRLARRYSYQELVMDELQEAGIEMIFVTVPAPKNSEDKILNGVRGLFAEYERAKIAERFRLGKLRKVKDGHILTTVPLYGHKYIPKQNDKHGYYEINEEEARVVRMIFKWVADEKLTMRSVVRRLQEMDIKPRKSKRGVWNTSTLSTLLKHKGYVGEAHWGSSYAVIPEKPLKIQKYKKMKKTSRKIRPEEEWYKISIPPIINKDLYDRARTQIELNFKLCQRNKKNDYLLAGVIYCLCGRRRVGEGSFQGKNLYYRCTDRTLRYPLPKLCNEKGINARMADKLVWNRILKMITSKELLMAQANRWLRSRKNKTELYKGDLGVMLKEIKKLKEQEDRYNKAYGVGVFTVEKLKGYTDPIAEKISSLETQIAKYKQEQKNVVTLLPEESEIKEFVKEAEGVIKTLDFKTKRDIITECINKIVGTKTKLKVAGCIPVTSQNVEFKTIHRNSGFA